MIKMHVKLPKEIGVAVSGGADSMAVLDFLRRGKNVTAYFFNHGTETSRQAQQIVFNYCEKNNIVLHVGTISCDKPKNKSLEEHWRDERYKFLRNSPLQIVTAHHLDDVVETWVFSSLHGQSKLIPLEHANIIRPFLTTIKDDFYAWCLNKGVQWHEDLSNKDLKFSRNRIRHIMPELMKINPGIHKVLRKKILERDKNMELQYN